MALVRTFDDPDTLYRLNADGETAETLVVLGKDAFDKAIKEGWTSTRPSSIRYPMTMYRAIAEAKLPVELQGKDEIYGEILTILSREGESAALRNGWHHKPIRALPGELEAWQRPDPLQQKVQIVTTPGAPAASGGTATPAELANALREIDELKGMISVLMDKKPAKGRRGRQARKHEPVGAE